MRYRNSVSLEEWIERARRGTSGDMVFDILADWKIDRDKLIEQIKNLTSTSTQPNHKEGERWRCLITKRYL